MRYSTPLGHFVMLKTFILEESREFLPYYFYIKVCLSAVSESVSKGQNGDSRSIEKLQNNLRFLEWKLKFQLKVQH